MPSGHIEVISRGVLVRGPWLLACRNLMSGYYYLPGGHIEFGEAAATALRRELIEEAGLRVNVGKLLVTTEGTFRTRKRPHHEINLVFHVKHWRGGAGSSLTPPPLPKSREPHIGFEWLDLRKMYQLDLRPSNLREWLFVWYRSRTHCSTWNTAMQARPRSKRK